jgi:hypothetical protein
VNVPLAVSVDVYPHSTYGAVSIFVGGLVFRELVELEALTAHSKSGMPLTKEFRTFFFEGAPLLTERYWEEGDYGDDAPPPDFFAGIARNVRSHFFTMDVARTRSGGFTIMELGDGQVSGLPDRLSPARFYEALAASELARVVGGEEITAL